MSAIQVLHITDPHLYAAHDGELRGVRTAESLRAVLETACSKAVPDAVLVTGDIAQDESRGAYERFRNLLEPCAVPVWCLPGNHDDPGLMEELLSEPPFRYCGVVAVAGWRVHLLPTWVEGQVGGRLDTDTLARLDEDLTTHGDQPALVCLHHHPVPVGSRWLDGIGLESPERLLGLADRHTQIRGLVWGHVHQSLEQHRGHYQLLATPSTCRQFQPRRDIFAVDNRPPAWRWLELRSDGTLASRLCWLDGAVPA